MLSLSLTNNQETVNQLNLKNPAQTLKDIHITYVIQLTEATQKTSKDDYPKHQRQLQTPCQGTFSLLRTSCRSLPVDAGLLSLSQCHPSKAAIC